MTEKLFRLQADAYIRAENIDDAMKKLSIYFSEYEEEYHNRKVILEHGEINVGLKV